MNAVFDYIVSIDEPGYGYAMPCCSYPEADRQAKKLVKQGFKVRITRITKERPVPNNPRGIKE